MICKITDEIIKYLNDRAIFLRPRFENGDALGKTVVVNGEVRVENFGRISEQSLTWPGAVRVGAFSYVCHGSRLTNTIIKRYSSIGSNVRVFDGDHPIDRVTTSTFSYGSNLGYAFSQRYGITIAQDYKLPKAPTTRIGNDVWVADDVRIKPGVQIGDGAVLAACSVVTKDVPAYAVVAGNPAKVVKFRFPEQVRAKLIALEWWNLCPTTFADLRMTDVGAFLVEMSKRQKSLPEFELVDFSAVVKERSRVEI